MPTSDIAERGAPGTLPPEQRMSRAGQVIAVVLFGAAAACGFWSAASAAQPAPSPTVVVIDYAFAPPNITVHAGGTVVFRNAGHATHRVVADDGSFDSHGLQPGHAWSVTVSEPATIAFHCAIHPQMTGEILVSRAAFGSPPPVTAATTGAHVTQLATTGTHTAHLLAFVAAVCLALGAAALVLARRAPVVLVALVPGMAGAPDDLLPARDRARR